MNKSTRTITLYVKKQSTKLLSANIARIVLSWLLAIFSSSLICQILFALFPWTLLPALLDGAIVIGLLGALIQCGYAVYRRPSVIEVARMLERCNKLQRPQLSLALELIGAEGSQQLCDVTADRALTALPLLCRSVPVSGIRQLIFLTPLLFALCCGSAWILRPGILAYMSLPFLLPDAHVQITPGTLHIPQNQSVVLRCMLSSADFPSLNLTIDPHDGSSQRDLLLRPDEHAGFSYQIDSLKHSFAYSFRGSSGALNHDTVHVIAPPAIRELAIALTPPGYTGLPSIKLPTGQGTFSALANTRVSWRLLSHYPLARADATLPDGMVAGGRIFGCSASGEWKVSGSGLYCFALADTFGQVDLKSAKFFITQTIDMSPTVKIPVPGRHQDLSSAMRETLTVAANDDFGIVSVAICWRKNCDPVDSVYRRELNIKQNQTTVVSRQAWNLEPLGLYPGDTLWYWATAQDANPAGAAGSSDTFWFRVPTMREIHEQVLAAENSSEKTLRDVRKKSDDLKADLARLSRASQRSDSLDWEKREAMQSISKEAAAQADSLRSAVESLKKTIEQLATDGRQSDEIVTKMNELQKAIEELARDFGDSLLLGRNTDPQDLTLKDLKEAVKKMESLMPQLAQRLDDALAYLASLRRDRQIATLAAEAQRLSDQALKSADLDKNSAQTSQQRKTVTKEARELGSRVEAASKPGEKQLFKPEETPALSDVDSLVADMERQTGQDQAPTTNSTLMLSSALGRMAEQLRSLQQNSMAARLQQERSALLDMAHQAIAAQQWHKRLSGSDLSGRSGSSESVQQFDALRSALESAQKRVDSLNTLGPDLRNSLRRQYGNITQGLSQIARSQDALSYMPGLPQNSAESQLSGLSMDLLDLYDQMGQQGASCASGKGGSAMEGLGKLSGRQAALNSFMQDLLRQIMEQQGQGQTSGNNKSGSAASREAARREQQAIADELARLQEQAEKEGAYGSGLAMRLKELAQEADRLARMTQEPGQQLRDNQDRFLARMLQTTLSMHREDEGDEERKATSAQQTFSTAAPVENSLERAQGIDALMLLRQRALKGRYPVGYRQAVGAYFDSLMGYFH